MAFFGLTTKSSVNKEKKKNKKLMSELDRVRQEEGPDQNAIRQQAKPHAEEMIAEANKGREEKRARGEEFHKREFTGLTPMQRQEQEAHANRRINKEVHRNQRELIAKQGHHGLRGGSAYAQKADLERLGHEARNEAQSNIRGLDAELALKKMASQFAIEEGGASERLLANQQAENAINLQEERKRNRKYEHQFNRIRG